YTTTVPVGGGGGGGSGSGSQAASNHTTTIRPSPNRRSTATTLRPAVRGTDPCSPSPSAINPPYRCDAHDSRNPAGARCYDEQPSVGGEPPSSSGLGRRPFKAVTGIRTP